MDKVSSKKLCSSNNKNLENYILYSKKTVTFKIYNQTFSGTNSNNSMQSRILFSIIVMFVFCQCFTIIPDIYELNCALSTAKDKQQCQYTYKYTYHLIEISHLMLAVNSSINFIFYMIHIKLFRESYKTDLTVL